MRLPLEAPRWQVITLCVATRRQPTTRHRSSDPCSPGLERCPGAARVLFQVEPTDPWTLSEVVVLLIVVAGRPL